MRRINASIGYLTIFAADRSAIYGEFADAVWTVEMTDRGNNNIFTGTASEGTMDTFLQLDKDAISHVAYTFDLDGQNFYRHSRTHGTHSRRPY